MFSYSCGGGGDSETEPTPTYIRRGLAQKTITESSSDLDTTPEEGALSPNPLLKDRDTLTNAFSSVEGFAAPWVNLNIGIRINSVAVDRLYLYTSNNVVYHGDNNPFSSAYDEGFIADARPRPSTAFTDWGIYTSDDGLNWTCLSEEIEFSYDYPTNCFELKFPRLKSNYIKIVVSYLDNSDAIYFTEIEAYNYEIVEIRY